MASRQKRPEVQHKRRRPATTPEAREQEMVSMAMELAENQIREGTASSQVITHFLKAGSLREQLEQERIAHENALLQVKKEALESAKRVEAMYAEALNAMRSYSGQLTDSDTEDDDV
jgi:hypothetical protein